MTLVITTDNGPHPASKMATICADQIVQYDQLDGDKMVKAQLLRAQLAAALEPHFHDVQTFEHDLLVTDSSHIVSPLLVDPSGAMFEVRKTTDASAWSDHYAQPEVDAAVSEIVKRHLMTAAHIERLWHADRNPTDSNVIAFKQG